MGRHQDHIPRADRTPAQTIAYLAAIEPEQFGDGTRIVSFPTQKESNTRLTSRYPFTRVLPKRFFHCTTSYDILRHNGTEIGKAGFLGPLAD